MTRAYYRTKDGLTDYGFSFEQQRDGSWRAYIESQPGYGYRDSGAVATHRLTDPASGRRYVCWEGRLRTEQEAQQVAKAWADKSQEYIKTGRRF